VEVDRPQIAAELAQLGSAAAAVDPVTPAPGAGAAPVAPEVPPDQRAGELAPMVVMVLEQVAETFAPNWEVSKAECSRLGGSVAAVLAYWVPQQAAVDPKYLALFSLAMSGWSVASARRDDNGKWRPLHKPAPIRTPAQQQQPDAAQPLRL